MRIGKQMREAALAATFVKAALEAVDQEHRRIVHSLGQLSEEDVWWRPGPGLNSVGVIIRHLCGNLRQWFLHGVGGEPDVRKRPAEFADMTQVSKAELLGAFGDLIARIHGVMDGVDAEKLLEVRRVQGDELDLVSAIFRTVTHLEGHGLQIAYVTHLRVGERYEPFWKPASVAEGA